DRKTILVASCTFWRVSQCWRMGVLVQRARGRCERRWSRCVLSASTNYRPLTTPGRRLHGGCLSLVTPLSAEGTRLTGRTIKRLPKHLQKYAPTEFRRIGDSDRNQTDGVDSASRDTSARVACRTSRATSAGSRDQAAGFGPSKLSGPA